ncbi:MAG: gamma-glutamyltransferase [Rhizobiaceae bacterium]
MSRDFQFPGRSAVHATGGMAATSHPLATGVAVDVLKAGGNALDAAIAANATLAVVEPQSTGIGGDCFVLMAKDGTDDVIGFNGSGRSPAAAELSWYFDRGFTEIPEESVHAATLPGAVDAWLTLHADHGRIPFADLLSPAIRYARDGAPVHARVRRDWLIAQPLLEKNAAAKAVYLPGGKVPEEGDLHVQKALADTLRSIAEGGRSGFYDGPVAASMVKTLRGEGGLHTLDDFAAVRGDYVVPISTDYRGYRVHQIPPNNQGITALIMLNLLERFDLAALDPLSVERTHLEIEAGRLAFAVRDAEIADESAMLSRTDRLLSKDWAAGLAGSIRRDKAATALPDLSLRQSDTVYVSVVDRDRNAVSFINSVYDSFGCGILCPDTGVMFQNRGNCFNVEPSHPNCIGPSKRPRHTIMPGMLTRDGRALMPYGVMGGDYQPFGHVRVLTNMIDYGLDPQAAIDMPRVFASDGLVHLEKTFSPDVRAGLAVLGHDVSFVDKPFGGGQAIFIDHARGIVTGGSDPRKDGCALGY